jgi:hypothetical protein
MKTPNSKYPRHKGLIINLLSIGLFLVWLRWPDQFLLTHWQQSRLLSSLFLIGFLLEPWAIQYCTRKLNKRRDILGLARHPLQKALRGPWGLIVWTARTAIYGSILIQGIQRIYGPESLQFKWLLIPIVILVLIRESWIIYQMTRPSIPSKLKLNFDWAANFVFIIILSFTELTIHQIFLDFGFKNIDQSGVLLAVFLPALFLLLVFYLPIRIFQTIEDWTFAQTPWARIENLLSLLILTILFLVR